MKPVTSRARRFAARFALGAGLSLLAGAASAAWPQYRGPDASGLDGRTALPTTWDVTTGENVRWHTPIPGLAHSSPIAWGDLVFVATAVSGKEAELKVGLYGNIDSANESDVQEWRLLALDKSTGRIVWDTLAAKGVPKVKRHTKASHCNSTPAADSNHVVAIFGSEGLFCFDTNGRLLWKKDLGPMDSGYYRSPTAQWGFGSSPILHDGKVVVLCDVQKDSFVAAFDVTDGHELWRTPRKDVPTWGTPTLVQSGGCTQIVANGWRETAGYDFATGKKLWTLDGGGDIPVPTPVFADGLIYLTSAHGNWRPMRAIRPDATGDITPEDPGRTNASIAWAQGRNGNYMQTPLVTGGLLFACNDSGILTCFDAKTGAVQFNERLSRRGQGFTASPVSDGRHLYFASETGNVFVVATEKKFAIKGVHQLPDTCMATPAIADDMLIFRTRGHLIALGEGGRAAGMTISAQTLAASEPPAIALARPDARLAGGWLGEIRVGDLSLRVRFSIEDDGASMKGTMTLLDQGNSVFPLSRVGGHDGAVRIETDATGAVFEGRWNEAKDELAGEWRQQEQSLPLTLKRIPPDGK
jgi:outer membrane protein assembly factor BamB